MSTTTTTGDNVHVKLQFNDEYRRFFFNRSCKFSELLEKVKTILSLKDEEFVIKYKDEEGEWITISSDMELETGLILAKDALFRLHISLVSQKKDTENVECRNEKPWKKFKKERRYRQCPTNEGEGDTETDECGGGRKKWKKFRQQRGEGNEDQFGGQKKWKKFRKQRMMRRFGDEEGVGSSSEENADALLSLEEINKQLEISKQELAVLKEKNDATKAELRDFKSKVREKRRTSPSDIEGLVEMRKTLKEKKEVSWTIFKELKSRRIRIKRLHDLAETKNV